MKSSPCQNDRKSSIERSATSCPHTENCPRTLRPIRRISVRLSGRGLPHTTGSTPITCIEGEATGRCGQNTGTTTGDGGIRSPSALYLDGASIRNRLPYICYLSFGPTMPKKTPSMSFTGSTRTATFRLLNWQQSYARSGAKRVTGDVV